MGVVAKVFDDTLYPCQVQPKENNISTLHLRSKSWSKYRLNKQTFFLPTTNILPPYMCILFS
jgi:hypothetical protein